MKCDELEKFDAASNADLSAGYDHRYAYDADEVDAAIAELKAELDKAIAERDGNQVCIDALKAKLESVQASMYADVVDANMENRRLKRALWMARAEKARFLAMIIDHHPYTEVLHFTSRKRDESGKPLGVARTAMVWWNMFKEVERKCRKKSKEYL